jgi:antitoxin YefM
MNVVTFTDLRKNLKHIMDMSMGDHEPVIVKRSQGRDMILLSLRDYKSLEETAYLLGNKANANHLRKSLKNLKEGKFSQKDLIEG